MFAIDPVQWLQTFNSPAVSWVMAGVTQLGYTPVYVLLLLFLALAVRLRPALAVLLGLLLAGIITEGLKTSLAFPRPDHVVQLQTRFPDRAAEFDSRGFWNLPSAETRAAVRATPGISYGFPSGHVSAAMAFCLGVAVFLRWRLFFALSCIWPVLMGLSRMYLGRHFLAGVLGGLAVGAVATALAALLLRWLDDPREPARRRRSLSLLCGGALILVALSVLVPSLDPENVGRLAALVWCYTALSVVGFPLDAGSRWQRAGRFAGGVLIYLAISRIVDRVLELSGWVDSRPAVLAAAAIVLGGTILGGVALGYRMRWYRSAV